MSLAYNGEGKAPLNKLQIIKKIAVSMQRAAQESWVPPRDSVVKIRKSQW